VFNLFNKNKKSEVKAKPKIPWSEEVQVAVKQHRLEECAHFVHKELELFCHVDPAKMAIYISYKGVCSLQDIEKVLVDLGVKSSFFCVDESQCREPMKVCILAAKGEAGVISTPPSLTMSEPIFDGHDFSTLQEVGERQKVGSIVAGKMGRPRVDVFGTEDELAPLGAGKLFDRQSFILESGDLLAAKKGFVTTMGSDQTICIKEEVMIKGDLKGQSIKCDVAIKVDGDVENGSIECESLTVKGTVNHSQVRVSGDLKVKQSIHGGSKGCLVEVKGDLEAANLKDIEIHVGGSLRVISTIYSSKVYCGQFSGTGAVINGSTLICADDVNIKAVGTDLSREASVIIAGRDERMDLIKSVIEPEIDELKKSMSSISDPVELKLLEDLIASKENDIIDRPGKLRTDVHIEIKGGLKQGTVIKIGDDEQEIPMDLDGVVKVVHDGGELKVCQMG
jgi:hypothetical protein